MATGLNDNTTAEALRKSIDVECWKYLFIWFLKRVRMDESEIEPDMVQLPGTDIWYSYQLLFMTSVVPITRKKWN